MNRKNFSKRKREKRGTQQLVIELSSAATASAAPPHSVPGLQRRDKQHQLSPETSAGGPHLKPWVGAHLDQWLAARHIGPSHGSANKPRPKDSDWPHTPKQWPGCLWVTTPKGTSSEQLLPSPCEQSPAGRTGSLGGRQNAQQRRAAGLGETAFPRKT